MTSHAADRRGEDETAFEPSRDVPSLPQVTPIRSADLPVGPVCHSGRIFVLRVPSLTKTDDCYH